MLLAQSEATIAPPLPWAETIDACCVTLDVKPR